MQHDYTTLAGIMAAADETQAAAKKMGLEFWLTFSFHWNTFDAYISKGIGGARLWEGCVMKDLTEKALTAKMEEAREFLTTYKENRAAELEKEVAELSETLKGKKAELRKVKKEETK